MFGYQAFDSILFPLQLNQIYILRSAYFNQLFNRYFNPLFALLFAIAGLLAYNTFLCLPLIVTSGLIQGLGWFCLLVDYVYIHKVEKRQARMEIYLLFFLVNGLQRNASE